jgi:hypothetical protein
MKSLYRDFDISGCYQKLVFVCQKIMMKFYDINKKLNSIDKFVWYVNEYEMINYKKNKPDKFILNIENFPTIFYNFNTTYFPKFTMSEEGITPIGIIKISKTFSEDYGHVGILIWTKKPKKIYLFDPYGFIGKFDAHISNIIEKKFANYKYNYVSFGHEYSKNKMNCMLFCVYLMEKILLLMKSTKKFEGKYVINVEKIIELIKNENIFSWTQKIVNFAYYVKQNELCCSRK